MPAPILQQICDGGINHCVKYQNFLIRLVTGHSCAILAQLHGSRLSMKRPIIVIFITIFIDMLGFGIIIPILPIFPGVRSRKLSGRSHCHELSLDEFSFALSGISLSDRHGRRPIILVSVLLTGLMYLLFSQKPLIFGFCCYRACWPNWIGQPFSNTGIHC